MTSFGIEKGYRSNCAHRWCQVPLLFSHSKDTSFACNIFIRFCVWNRATRAVYPFVMMVATGWFYLLNLELNLRRLLTDKGIMS